MSLDLTHVKQRQLIVALLSVAACALVVYLLPMSFHDLLRSNTLGMSNQAADTLAAVIVMVSGFSCYKLLFIASNQGLSTEASSSQQQVDQRLFSDEAIINSVASDLGDLPALTKLIDEQLHAVSVETERAAFVIMERIQAMDGVVSELLPSLGSRLQPSDATLEPALNNGDSNPILLASSIDPKQHRLTRDKELIAEIEHANATLTAMFMDTLSDMQFQDVTRQQIEQVQNALGRLDTHIAQLVAMMHSKDFSNAASIKEHIDQIYESYVMDKQRDVHASAMTNDTQTATDVTAPKKIELF